MPPAGVKQPRGSGDQVPSGRCAPCFSAGRPQTVHAGQLLSRPEKRCIVREDPPVRSEKPITPGGVIRCHSDDGLVQHKRPSRTIEACIAVVEDSAVRCYEPIAEPRPKNKWDPEGDLEQGVKSAAGKAWDIWSGAYVRRRNLETMKAQGQLNRDEKERRRAEKELRKAAKRMK